MLALSLYLFDCPFTQNGFSGTKWMLQAGKRRRSKLADLLGGVQWPPEGSMSSFP